MGSVIISSTKALAWALSSLVIEGRSSSATACSFSTKVCSDAIISRANIVINSQMTDFNEGDDPLKDAFDNLKLPGKETVDLAEVLEEVNLKTQLAEKYPLARQFLEKTCTDELIGGISYEVFKDEVDYYFQNDDDDEDDEDEEAGNSGALEFGELKAKLSLFAHDRKKLEQLWETLRLDDYFTVHCREYIISNLLSAKPVA